MSAKSNEALRQRCNEIPCPAEWRPLSWNEVKRGFYLNIKEDMRICGVVVIFGCDVAVNKIPSWGVAMILNRALRGVSGLKLTVLYSDVTK